MANDQRIIDVWADDLEAEMERIREVIEKYPFVAMVRALQQRLDTPCGHSSSIYAQDTEFPGVVARPMGKFRTSSDYHYQTLRSVELANS